VFVPVKNYNCVINTGDAPPIVVKKIQYGLEEIPIMHQAISALKKVEHIHQFTTNGGFSRPYLHLNFTRSMFAISTTLSGNFA
jgi:hypothetical protein